MAETSPGRGRWAIRHVPPTPRSIVELIRAGTLDAELAATLWLLIEGRVPLIVGALPRLAGKSTLLDALLMFLPPGTRTVELEGAMETFDWLPQAPELGWRATHTPAAIAARVSGRKAPTVRPDDTVLLIPELSDHLPSYTWGAEARIAIRAVVIGYGLAATIHADSLDDVFDQLRRPPVSLGDDELSSGGARGERGREARRLAGQPHAFFGKTPEENGNTDNDLGSITEMSVRGQLSAEQQTCTIPKITGISATGNDGNKPQNTLDNNANTRWSNSGLPSWIQYNLGSSQRICDVDISWYRGNQRVNTFTISASEDGQSFRTIFIGKSSGKTISPEAYNVIDTNAKYLRITDLRNSENSWASITEVDINGDTRTPSPSPEICGNGIDDDGDKQIDEGCSTGGQTDPFGIQKIYPTKAGGEEWFMDMTDGEDPRSNPPSLRKNSDGSFKVTSSQVRYGAYTTDGYDPEKINTLDHGTIAQNGYMQSSKDWKNVEMTGYVKVNSGQSGENFAWYARGGRHTGDGNPEGCEGVAYKADLGYDGRTRFAKEQWHVSYDFTDHKNPMSSIEDKWVGFKGIMWNMVQNGQTVVKMEIWVDKNEDGKQDGPWVKVDENTDSGGWGNSGNECGGASDQIITWGGPVATFRWDGASDVDIKNFSVREIQPPS